MEKKQDTISPSCFSVAKTGFLLQIKKLTTLLLFVPVFFVFNAGSSIAQESIGVYISPPGELEYNTSHLPGFIPTVEDFNSFTAPNNNWAPPPAGWTGSPLGTYFQLPTANANNRLEPDNNFGAGTGNYIVVFDDAQDSHIRLELDEPTGYFGFAWPAGDAGNSLIVYSEGSPVFTITTDDIVNLLPNTAGTTVTALDDSEYFTQDYYCKPGTTDNCSEPYAFLHFIASEGLYFDAIEFHMTGGGGFEIDNHTILNQQPDPPTENPWVVVYEIVSPTANDDESLGNTPGAPVTIDVLANDLPGSDADGDPVPIDPGTVIITGTLPPGSTLSPDGKTLEVPGEGEWTVDEITGEITFTPEPGFAGNPTPIQYRVSDEDGTASNIANVTVTFASLIEANDDSAGPVDGIEGTEDVLNVFDNDELNGDPVDPEDVTLTVTTPDPTGSLTVITDPEDENYGSVSVEPGTPDGEYSFEYEICENDDPTNCDTATVTITVQSTISIDLTGGPCWRFLSSPVDGLTYDQLLGNLWTQGIDGSDYNETGVEPNIFIWPNTDGNDPADWQPLGNMNTTIPAGSGFLISVFTDDEYGTEGTWPKTLTVSDPEHAAPVTINGGSMNQTSGGWTLVGNPFKSPIDFEALTTAGTNDLTDIAYIYDRNLTGEFDGTDTNGNTGGWRTTDGTYGDITDGIISPFQGFFVQNVASPASPSVEFTDDSRTTGGEFYGKERELRDYVRLEVRGEQLYNSMWVRFSDAGSLEHTRGDALKLQPLAEEYALLASRKADGTLTDIGHYPHTGDELTIPVSFQATRPGSYTITATDLDLPAGAELYFTDLQTNQTLHIDEQFKYSFTLGQADPSAEALAKAGKASPGLDGITPCQAGPQMAKTAGNDRFVITTSARAGNGELPAEITLQQNYPNPFNPSTVIRYELPQQSQVRLEVFDLNGRLVATLVEGTVQAGVHTVSFDANHLSSGVYLYTLSAGGVALTRKLTLIK